MEESTTTITELQEFLKGWEEHLPIFILNKTTGKVYSPEITNVLPEPWGNEQSPEAETLPLGIFILIEE